MHIIIKLLSRKDDKFKVEILRCEVFELTEIGPYYISKILENKEFVLAAFTEDYRAVGGCYFHRYENNLVIDQVFVKKEYQNKGYKIGRSLIKTLIINREYISKILGSELRICRIDAKDEKSKTLYKKIGFKDSCVDEDALIKPLI